MLLEHDYKQVGSDLGLRSEASVLSDACRAPVPRAIWQFSYLPLLGEWQGPVKEPLHSSGSWCVKWGTEENLPCRMVMRVNWDNSLCKRWTAVRMSPLVLLGSWSVEHTNNRWFYFLLKRLQCRRRRIHSTHIECFKDNCIPEELHHSRLAYFNCNCLLAIITKWVKGYVLRVHKSIITVAYFCLNGASKNVLGICLFILWVSLLN